MRTALCNLFRARPKSARRPAARLRLGVQQLDDRIVPATPAPVTFHGGAVLAHANVTNVFYGQNWSTDDSWGLLRGGLDQFQSDILRSPYMAQLGEYGVGRGSYAGYDNVISGPTRGNTVSESQIQGMLQNEILNGRVPWPSGGQQLYFVYLAPGVNDSWDINPTHNAAAHHGSFLMLPGTWAQTPVYYAVVPDLSATFQTLTKYSSHELAEAATDPDVRLNDGNPGFSYTYGAWFNNINGEIGDGLESQYVNNFVANGHTYTVQKEWSNWFGRGIVADGSKAGMLDVPTRAPYYAQYFSYVGNIYFSNYYGRSMYGYAGSGYDGLTYYNFTTAAGDSAGWFTIQS